jgi:hypothetical protein
MTMPTREEIMECLQEGSSSKQWILLRRIADAMDGCVKDAERYRWLRECKSDDLYVMAFDPEGDSPCCGGEIMDRAIDSAMLASANKEKAGDTSNLEATARKLYVAWTDAQGIHCNRFPAWQELPESAREKWRAMAITNKERGK